MLQTRVIPCLLLRDRGLVKTTRFKNPVYVGDPINAVRIFNDKEVDELVVLDIFATAAARPPSFDLIGELVTECFMPLCYGGGVATLEHIRALFKLGVEKVSLNTQAVNNPDLIRQAAEEFGSQSIVVSVDVKTRLLGTYEVATDHGTRGTGEEPSAFAARMEALGAGEIFLNAVDRDGTMKGYDLTLIRSVIEHTTIPVVACGGAGSLQDFAAAVHEAGASAVAAGSMFVFYGPHRAVLINYPPQHELRACVDKSQ